MLLRSIENWESYSNELEAYWVNFQVFYQFLTHKMTESNNICLFFDKIVDYRQIKCHEDQ